MFVRKGVCVGLLLCASLALAQDNDQRSARGVRSKAPSTEQAAPSTIGPQLTRTKATNDLGADLALAMDRVGELVPRQPIVKRPQVFRTAETSGRIIVKFMDSVTARARNDGTMMSVAGVDTTAIDELAERLGLTFEPAIKLAADKLAQIQLRAASQSGVAQPDLAGILYVDGPAEALEEVAPIFLAMPIVEYVEFEPTWELDLGPPANDDCASSIEVFDGPNGPFSNAGATDDGPSPGACGATIGSDIWFTYNAAFNGFVSVSLCAGTDFDTVLAIYDGCTCPADQVDLLACVDDGCGFEPEFTASEVAFPVLDGNCYLIQIGGDEGVTGSFTLTIIPTSLAACDNPFAGSCFDEAGNGSPGCFNLSNLTCCATVCEVAPDCCNIAWDAFCAQAAVLLCNESCGHPDAGDCLDSSGSPFCDDEMCCEIICAIDPGCCDPDLGWEQGCADLAFLFCEGVCNENAGSCFESNGTPGCSDDSCCTIVCAVEPDCCDVEWDTFCAQIAQFGCDEPTGCPSIGSCFEPHGAPGCEDATCCNLVCTANPLCCDLTWDDGCVELAIELCPDDDTGPTPDFTSLQGYRTSTGGGYDLEGTPEDPFDGLYGLGQFVFEVLGRGEQNQARGKTIKVGVIEFSAWLNHEDLKDSDGNRVVNLDPDVSIDDLFTLNSSWLNHGTATLGEIAAVENSFGVTGIAPDAEPWFFPIVTFQGGRAFTAWGNALVIFGPGDVLSASYGPAGCGTLATSPTMWTLFRTASDLGITVCISAGNDCCDLGTAPQANGDSGAIIVGAGFAGSPWCRLGFSNFHKAPNSATEDEQVHVQAWGTAVTTLGYGGLFLGNGNPNRSYSSTFGGTSSAAPMVAGLVADLQGLAKQFHGIPLMPNQIRDILTACPGPTLPQCLVPFCNEDNLPGAPPFDDPPPPECLGDLDPDGDPNVIGPFAEARGAGLSVMTGSFFDGSPLLGDIEILRGTLIFGNANSIKASDNNRLSIKSQLTRTTANIDLGIVYLAPGQITDLLIIATADIDNVSSMTITHEAHASDAELICPAPLSGTALVFYEMYDWNFNRWSFVAFDNLSGADPPELGCPIPPFNTYPVDGPTRFVRAGDGRILLRIWTLSLGLTFGGFGGPQSAPYVVRHDWIDIQVGGGGPGDIVVPP